MHNPQFNPGFIQNNIHSHYQSPQPQHIMPNQYPNNQNQQYKGMTNWS